MKEATLAISIVWIFLFIYAMAGSVDFGAGFWAMVFRKRGVSEATVIANRFLSPAWKVTNVFLVLVVVALVGFFPGAAYFLGTLLIVPVSLVLILLTIRSTFMVYAYSSEKYRWLLEWVSGTTGLLIPGLLITVLPATLGGFIDVSQGYPVPLVSKLLSSPTEYAHLGFGLTTELFLSALFLADYAREADDEPTYRAYRKAAIACGPIALGMALVATFAMDPEASWMVERMKQQWLWFLLSALAFLYGYASLWLRQTNGKLGKPRYAVLAVVAQYLFASIGYGAAHLPYIVYPYLTVEDSVTNSTMFNSLLIGYTVGSLVLFPAFYWFWKLFMKDKRYLRQK